MADDEKESEATATRGSDWEVVQLTASTYAAAPGPKGFGPDEERNEQDSSSAMFMSDQFVFPPSEHENLLIEPEYSGIHSEPVVQDESSVEEEAGGGSNKNEEEILENKSDDEQHGIQFVDSGRTLSVPGIEFEEGKAMQVLNLTGDVESMYVAPEPNDPSFQYLDSPKHTKTDEEDKYDGSGLPCEAWWKRHGACLYRHAKEANTFWSIFVAAALMGLVIFGKRWHQGKLASSAT